MRVRQKDCLDSSSAEISFLSLARVESYRATLSKMQPYVCTAQLHRDRSWTMKQCYSLFGPTLTTSLASQSIEIIEELYNLQATQSKMLPSWLAGDQIKKTCLCQNTLITNNLPERLKRHIWECWGFYSPTQTSHESISSSQTASWFNIEILMGAYGKI